VDADPHEPAPQRDCAAAGHAYAAWTRSSWIPYPTSLYIAEKLRSIFHKPEPLPDKDL